MNIHHLAPDEPLSPELVLVLEPEVRAQVIARLGPPARPTPARRAADHPPPPPPVDGTNVPSLGALLVARVGQLALIFLAVTILVLAMSLVASATR